MRNIIILIGLIGLFPSFSYSGTRTNGRRAYFLLNTNSCSTCNMLSRELLRNELIFNKISFLLSPEEVTMLQAETFLEEMFGKKCKVTLDAHLYNQFAKEIGFFKYPYLVIYDSLKQQTLFKTTVDSLNYYEDIIHGYLGERERHEKVIQNGSLKRLIGSKEMHKIGGALFILPYTKRDRLFIYNIKTNKLDSIYLSNTLVKRLFELYGEQNIDVKRTRQFYKDHMVPYRLAEFEDSYANDKHYYSYLDLVLVDTINPDNIMWYPFIFRYDPVTHLSRFYKYKWWQSDSSYYTCSAKQDFYYKEILNDSILLIGGDKRSDNPNSKSKLILEYAVNDSSKTFRYNEKSREIKIDSTVSFKGEHLNDPIHSYPYTYKNGYLYFNESPFLYDTATRQTFNIRNIDKNIDWLFDISVDRDLLRILTQRNKNFLLLTLDRKTYGLIQSEEIVQRKNGDGAVLDGESIYYMDKSGNIIESIKE